MDCVVFGIQLLSNCSSIDVQAFLYASRQSPSHSRMKGKRRRLFSLDFKSSWQMQLQASTGCQAGM
jgi:hypothetical protein